MKFEYKSEDGEVGLRNLKPLRDLETIKLGTPHKGSTCSFKIISSEKISTGQETNNNIPVAPSTYLAVNDPESNLLSAVIGITSTSDFDRLLEVCLTRLHVGEIGEFEIKCYRSESSYNVTLELVQIKESVEIYDLNKERIEEMCTSLKDTGVLLFTQGYVVDAFYKFSEAMKLSSIPHPRTRKSSQIKFISTLQSNMASCHVKLGNWEAAIDLCNSVLEHDPNNVKALYRRGLSLLETQEYEKAEQDLQLARQLDPENQAVKHKLAVLEERNKALNAKYAQAMKKYFS